jgi:hypothetical protein
VAAKSALSFTHLITDWNIQSRGYGCEVCGKPFADKETYHTVLLEERADLRRSDVCAACWQGKFENARGTSGFISCWQGVYQAPPPPVEAIKKETAETLLRKLIELNDPQYIPAGFILAVMLERKRLLKVKEQMVRDGRRVFIYEQPGTGDVFTIIDPDLHLDQLEQVQRDVAALLEHGLNPPVPPAADAPAADAAGTEPSMNPAESTATPAPAEAEVAKAD